MHAFDAAHRLAILRGSAALCVRDHRYFHAPHERDLPPPCYFNLFHQRKQMIGTKIPVLPRWQDTLLSTMVELSDNLSLPRRAQKCHRS